MNRVPVSAEIDNTGYDPGTPTELVLGGETFTSITDRVCGIVEQPKPPKAWYIAITLTGSLTVVLFAMLFHLITTGIGV